MTSRGQCCSVDEVSTSEDEEYRPTKHIKQCQSKKVILCTSEESDVSGLSIQYVKSIKRIELAHRGANWTWCSPFESDPFESAAVKGTRRLTRPVPSRVEGSPAPPHVTAAAQDTKFTSALTPAVVETFLLPMWLFAPPPTAESTLESPRLRCDANELLSRKVPSSKSTAAAPWLRCSEMPPSVQCITRTAQNNRHAWGW